MTYDIELGQGDSDSIGVLLKVNGSGANLTDSQVMFSMKNESETEFAITCRSGAFVNGSPYSETQGGTTIPFTSIHTAAAGIFKGKFTVTKGDVKTTFPSGSDYISVRIWEAI